MGLSLMGDMPRQVSVDRGGVEPHAFNSSTVHSCRGILPAVTIVTRLIESFPAQTCRCVECACAHASATPRLRLIAALVCCVFLIRLRLTLKNSPPGLPLLSLQAVLAGDEKTLYADNRFIRRGSSGGQRR